MSEFTKEEMKAAALKSTGDQRHAGWEGESSAADTAQNNNAGSTKQNEDALVYICPSCGAEVVTDATTAATFCYYCHNPVVLGKAFRRIPAGLCDPLCHGQEESNGGYSLTGSRRKIYPG